MKIPQIKAQRRFVGHVLGRWIRTGNKCRMQYDDGRIENAQEEQVRGLMDGATPIAHFLLVAASVEHTRPGTASFGIRVDQRDQDNLICIRVNVLAASN